MLLQHDMWLSKIKYSRYNQQKRTFGELEGNLQVAKRHMPRQMCPMQDKLGLRVLVSGGMCLAKIRTPFGMNSMERGPRNIPGANVTSTPSAAVTPQ